MKLYQDDNTKKAFVMYILGSVNSWGVCQHDRYNTDEGLLWARQKIESAFWKVTEKVCDRYTRTGCFSIYQGQELTPENRVYMDLFEALIYGDNTAETNRAEEMPKEVTQKIALSIHTIYRLLTTNDPNTRKEKAEGAKAYDAMFKDIEKAAETAKREAARDANNEQFGIGWLKFYVKWRFPLGFIFGALSIISEIAEGTRYGYFTIPLFVGLFVVDILIYFFRIYVYSGMRDMTESGYSANMVLLVLESLLLAFNAATRNGSDWMNSLIITLPLAFLIWWLPNVIYFSHRKHLFTGMFSINELSADYIAQENDSEQGDKKDGSKVPDEKFYCTACGKKSTGWYQACPHCGAVGKMEKVSSALEEPVVKSIPSKPDSNNAPAEAPVLFCRECGARLNPDALFCSECGTPVSVVKKQSAELPLHDEQKNHTAPSAPTHQEEPITIDLHDRRLPPQLRRAFLFIEEGEWDKANEYLERVLDEEPENAYAYLGKLLVELQVEEIEQLLEKKEEIKNSRNYKRAMRYSDEKLKCYLDAVLSDADSFNNVQKAEAICPEERKDAGDTIEETEGHEDSAISEKELFDMLIAAQLSQYSHKDELFSSQQYNKDNYGFDASNPIMTEDISASKEYLSRLQTADGKAVTWNREGSICVRDIHGVKDVMVDIYQLFVNNSPVEKIYICPYSHQSTVAPKGYNLRP